MMSFIINQLMMIFIAIIILKEQSMMKYDPINTNNNLLTKLNLFSIMLH